MNTQMRKVQQGFTLIELMIVVAIIGILAAVAIPAYQDYVKKSKFAHSLSAAESFKTPVAMCLQDNAGSLTGCSAGALGIPSVGTLPAEVSSVTVSDGVITVTASSVAGGYTWKGTPTVSGSQIIWGQTGTCLAAGYCK